MTTTELHPSLTALRRAFALEKLEPADQAHLETCAACRARLDELRAEQRRFEEAVPFERFAAGVERAARDARPAQRPARLNLRATLALAAGLALLVGSQRLAQPPQPANHLKGGAGVELVVSTGSNGAQRVATLLGPEALAPGERVRVGVSPAGFRYVVVLSIDAGGTVTPVYAAAGHSLPLSGRTPEFLPDSLEFTGAGLEHVVVVLSERPLDVDVVATALRRQFAEANGDLTKLDGLAVPGEQFHRTFLKP